MDWRLQRHPIARVIVLALLGFVALAAWGLSSPAGSSPDDDFHLTSIWCAQGERAGLCENITTTSVNVPNDVVHAPCFAFNKDITGACQANLGTAMTAVDRANILEHSYPGGFYWAMSWFAGPNVYLSVVMMRLFNALLFVLMATVTFLLIEPRWRQPLALGVATTIVPLGMFIIPSTNPSSWTIYAPAFVFLLSRSLIRTTERGKVLAIAAATVIISAIASSARSDAAIFVVAAVSLAAVPEWRSWFRRPAFYATAALVGGVAIWSMLAGRQSAAASSGLNGDATAAAKHSIGLLLRNIVDLPGLFTGALGSWNLGWLDTPMPTSVWVGMTVVVGALAMSAIAYKQRKHEFLVPALAALFMIAVPLAISQSSGSAIGSYVQPRYVLPLLALTLVALFTTETPRLAISQRQLIITAVVVVAANAIALAANALRYSSGLSAVIHLSGWDGGLRLAATIAVGALAAAGLMALSMPRTAQVDSFLTARDKTPQKS